ncbi:MAG TPA: NAD(P)/FAD-dependent oxidoreductase, partial [Pyrinomonadaceae bacterium]|jgi:flavin-dependent dehydrogenase|nr:NAD(P)/FAD-dependent oxidoreductase [Pyrinomonadaceae bacterium]
MHSAIANTFDVIIAGAGPAGSSAAIHLARNGLRVLLVEQKKFPRAKLCGEFISPECQRHFENLGVADAIKISSPTPLTETVFYSSRGHHVSIPSDWFGGSAALGLSRAVMDNVLLQRARDCGVTVLEGSTITEPILEGGDVRGVRLKTNEQYFAPLTIDATGRAHILTRKLKTNKSKPKLVAFKVHLRNTRVAPNACEIYFYPEGYGGLSSVEGDVSNLCFIISAEQVKRHNSNPELVMREMVMKNQRAAHTLEHAQPESEWLSASWERFGRQQPSPANGLLAIGDSAAFIDPFTGSGMLMAFESGELVAQIIVRDRDKLTSNELCANYAAEYAQKFDSRLRICGWLRRLAFRPRLAGLGIAICGASNSFRNRIARATRSPNRDPHTPLRAG